jgi:hypothetical protein
LLEKYKILSPMLSLSSSMDCCIGTKSKSYILFQQVGVPHYPLSRVQEHCLYRSVFILGYGGDSKRRVGSGFRIVRLVYIRESTYLLSQLGKEESILEQVQQGEEDHRPKCDATMPVKSSSSHHES